MNKQLLLSLFSIILIFQIGNSRNNDFLDHYISTNENSTFFADCVDIDTTICSDEIFVFENQEYSQGGTYTLTSSTCEGSFLLNLTVVLKPEDIVTNVTLCEGELCYWPALGWCGNNADTTYIVLGENCTANQILHLNYINIEEYTTNYTLCGEGDSYVWSINGQVYTQTGIYYFEGSCELHILALYSNESCHGTQGKAIFDYDNNGCDNLDPLINDLNLINEDFSKKTTVNGTYVLPSLSNSATIEALHDNPIYNVTPIDTVVTFENFNSYITVDYCLTTQTIINDLAISISPLGFTRPGIPSDFRMYCTNNGTTALSGIATLQIDSSQFSSATPDTFSTIGNNYTWEIETILPGQQSTIDLTLIPDFQLVDEDILSIGVNISHDVDDSNPFDNTFVLEETIRTSYDPNDKTILEGASLHPSSIGEYVHYMIRFENVGTAPAYYVRLIDTLDTNVFDVRTFQIVDTSHPCEVEIENGNILKILYEAIELPFLEEDGNKGYFTFRIKTKESLKVGDQLKNNAKIIFDFNPPIFTNTSEAIFEYPQILSVNDIENDFLSVTTFPNPAKDIINLIIEDANLDMSFLDIYNKFGVRVLSSKIREQNTQIDCTSLSPGTYIIKVSNKNKVATERLLIIN